LRPIRCKKIRYYRDPRFRRRLLPPPQHATPVPRTSTPAPSRAPITAAAPAAADSEALTAESRSPGVVLQRVAAVDDIERLDSITIEDFGDRLKNLTFEQAGERPTESELDADVNVLLDALR
jgi:hypothetical protein